MGPTLSVLMCHAPIVLPEVGGSRGAACAKTTAAMASVAARVVARAPTVLVVISPHAPRHRSRWGVMMEVRGDLSRFGAPGVSVGLPTCPGFVEALQAQGVGLQSISAQPLDHGAVVPLAFVVQAGWSGPTVVLSQPWDEAGVVAFGEALGAACEAYPGEVALLASGDMSHRLIEGAPAGYHPRAEAFDLAFVRALRAGDLSEAVGVEPALRELAAEDVVVSVAVAEAACGWRSQGYEVLAYEGPFGVGYCEAVLTDREVS